MATRKRIAKTVPDFRVTGIGKNAEEEDLKKVKARVLKELEEDQKNKKDWFDQELDKNLKKQ